MRSKGFPKRPLQICIVISLLFLCFTEAHGQEVRSADSSSSGATESPAEVRALSDLIRDLQVQVQTLHSQLGDVRAEQERASSEARELRRELDLVKAQGPPAGSGPANPYAQPSVKESTLRPSSAASSASPQSQNPQDRIDKLEEDQQVMEGKINDQYQTKVESGSKYRLRLSGLVLLNLFENRGSVDNMDFPETAESQASQAPDASSGSFGGSLRQSQIRIQAFGPDIAGARTSADVNLDFAGGFPNTPNGAWMGLVRMRTATGRLDWGNTSIVAGQDRLFFVPLAPTSLATLATPALSYAGNLWSWVPQIRVEHRVVLGEESSLTFQGGILDPVSGEAPQGGFYRQAGPGELSRQPAYAARIAWTHDVFGQPLRVGFGGFYSRQDYRFSRTVDGWAGMTDIELPLSHQFSLSGKLYRGKGLGGLGGGIGRSALFSGDPALASTRVQGLNSVGGWAQLKYRPSNKLEFNAAFGMDNPYASDLKYFKYAQAYGDPTLARNQGSFVNMIYRPRSDLLFSAEYRHLTTYTITEGGNSAGHLNLMMGVLF